MYDKYFVFVIFEIGFTVLSITEIKPRLKVTTLTVTVGDILTHQILNVCTALVSFELTSENCYYFYKTLNVISQ